MSADDYNAGEFEAGRFTTGHISELVRRFQKDNALPVDGKFGPTTRAVLELLQGREAAPTKIVKVPVTPAQADPLALRVDETGWLVGRGVEVMSIHSSWHYPKLSTEGGTPRAIVAHYTATDHGTARNMAKHRARPMMPGDRAASWHVSIEGDGSIVQMARFTVGCWHAGGATAKPIPGLGSANRTSVGIELVGYGVDFPEAQVIAAQRVWRALVRAYKLSRDWAMVTHESLDPTRKADPGKIWMEQRAPGVLDYAFA